jgi:Na+-translocating ferredoxin:NAD+ oxidoreductase RnfE subunit
MNKFNIFKNGITTENPILVQQVGMCATLSTSFLKLSLLI